ncbi:hypothetical protein IFM89_025783 [Coptis chinensis]|uniref:Uncharacterized protein n=1 Tax=Coptis chinensis TaxID=261450 RepID=A0A835LSR4_9MAGN|nr:hypothetical protein IFM89_025783 [Coptis chinensis]
MYLRLLKTMEHQLLNNPRPNFKPKSVQHSSLDLTKLDEYVCKFESSFWDAWFFTKCILIR